MKAIKKAGLSMKQRKAVLKKYLAAYGSTSFLTSHEHELETQQTMPAADGPKVLLVEDDPSPSP